MAIVVHKYTDLGPDINFTTGERMLTVIYKDDRTNQLKKIGVSKVPNSTAFMAYIEGRAEELWDFAEPYKEDFGSLIPGPSKELKDNVVNQKDIEKEIDKLDADESIKDMFRKVLQVQSALADKSKEELSR